MISPGHIARSTYLLASDYSACCAFSACTRSYISSTGLSFGSTSGACCFALLISSSMSAPLTFRRFGANSSVIKGPDRVSNVACNACVARVCKDVRPGLVRSAYQSSLRRPLDSRRSFFGIF